MSDSRRFRRGEKQSMVDNYLNLKHGFLWTMIERVNAGEDVAQVMRDYGWIPDPSCGKTQS